MQDSQQAFVRFKSVVEGRVGSGLTSELGLSVCARKCRCDLDLMSKYASIKSSSTH